MSLYELSMDNCYILLFDCFLVQTRRPHRGCMGGNALHGPCVSFFFPFLLHGLRSHVTDFSQNLLPFGPFTSGYLESCRSIVGAAQQIADAIHADIPELYILGQPPASVVAFGSRVPEISIHEVGDAMSKKGWHLSALANPAAVHIAVTVCGEQSPFSSYCV